MSVQTELLAEFPTVRIEAKADHLYWKLIGRIVWVFTLGRNDRFMISQTTTIGTRIGVTADWEDMAPNDQDVILAHERVHLRQQRAFGFGSVWLGLVPWGLVWLLFPLPVFVAWGRYALEREAYLETLRRDPEQFGDVVEALSGAHYGWAWLWPDSIAAWFRARL
jgi:hypothetical protein